MNYERKKDFLAFIAIIIFVSLLWTGAFTAKSVEFRRLHSEYRNRIAYAEDTNRRLTEKFEQCKSICGDITESVDRNITNAREAVEVLEVIREQVAQLEMCCGSFDYDSYYRDTDAYLGITEGE